VFIGEFRHRFNIYSSSCVTLALCRGNIYCTAYWYGDWYPPISHI